jgi:uncharacterized RDD family membrane protein YckC
MAEVVSGEAVVLDVPVAQFPSRIIAQLIDILVQIGALSVLLGIVSAAQIHLNPDALAAVLLSAVILTLIGYPCIFETLSRGKSLGKLALGLRVVGDDGGPERFRQAFLRAFFGLFEIWIFTGGPALICSMLSVKGKRFGDLFAGTFVIQERLPRRPPLPPWLSVVPPPLYGWAQTLEMSALQDLAAEQAASYLRRIWELNPVVRDQLGHQIATAVAAQVTPPPPPGTPVVPFLSAVLAVRRHREMWRLAAQRGWPGPAGPAPYGPAFQPPAPYQAGAYAAAQPPAPQTPAPQAQPAAPAPAAPAVSTDTAPRTDDQPGSGGFAPPA